MRNISIIASFIALTACGAMNQNQQSSKPVVTEESAKAQSATLPAVTIVRVPVGADGKEIHENAEIRLANQTSLSKDNVASAFDAAKAPTATVDELDGSSSTESYHGYRNAGHYYRRHHGHHGHHNGGVNWNWNFYRPTYYYYGYYYNWNYYNTYNCGGYNYYQYNYNNCGNYCYNGIGQAPGYGISY